MSPSPLSHRPLGPSDPLYVARPEEESHLKRALELGLNVAVVGTAGTGKTTLVRRVLDDLGLDQQQVVWVDGRGVTVHEAVDRIAESFGWVRDNYRLELKPRFRGFAESVMERVPIEPDPNRIDTNDLPFLERVIADAPKVLDVDEFSGRWLCVVDTLPRGAIEELFGSHRERLWEVPVQWVLISRTHPPSTDLFFEETIPLGELPESLAHRLVALRLNATNLVGETEAVRLAAAIASQVPTRPRDLVAAAREAVLQDADKAEQRFKLYAELGARAAELGEAHATLMTELISVGGAHASDAELQRGLGYSRPQIVKLLGDLEDAGLVERRPDRRRIVFIPVERVP